MTTTVHLRELLDGQPVAPALDALLAGVGGLSGRVGAGDRVLLKPNFVAPFARATTGLDFVAHIAARVRETGAEPVLGESSGFEFETEQAFRVLGVRERAEAIGLAVVNLEREAYREVDLGGGVGSVEMSQLALDAKLILNLPVLKGHAITRMTGAVKNSFGLISKRSRRHLHSHGLERSIARLARFLSGKSLHVVDARRKLDRAVFAQARPLGYALAGDDAFALDDLGARLLGVDPGAVRHLDRVPPYRVEGARPPALGALRRRSSAEEGLRRFAYSLFYWLDETKERLFGGASIIHDLHWYLGVHPSLREISEDEARQVAAVCPVDAVDVERRAIDKSRCETVRCLACYREYPQLVRLRGLNRPRREVPGA